MLVFVPSTPLQAILMFASTAGAYLIKALYFRVDTSLSLVLINKPRKLVVFVTGKPYEYCVMKHTSLFRPFVSYKGDTLS